MTNFQLCYRSAIPHGIFCGVKITDSQINWSSSALKKLHPEEISYAKSLNGFRQRTWVAGRIAIKHAISSYSSSNNPVLSDPYGCPIAPKNYVLSITHKEKIAFGIVASDNGQSIGIDFEHFEPERIGIMSRVLRDEELEQVDNIHQDRKWMATLIYFSAKEAIYKAIAPRHKRYIGFKELALYPKLDGRIEVQWHLEKGPEPQSTELRYIWLENGILTTAQIHW